MRKEARVPVALRDWRTTRSGLRAYDCERMLREEGSRSRMVDPRVQLGTLIVMNLLATTPTPDAVDALGVALGATVLLRCRRAAACVAWCVGYALLWSTSWLCSLSGDPVFVSVGAMLALMRKMYVIGMLAVNLVLTVRVGELACALQRMHVPRLAIVALSVALRFFPTLSVEAASVLDAMKMRGIRMTPLQIVRHPLATVERFAVPLMLRVSVVVDEMSRAATVRGIDSSHERSSLYELRIGRADRIFIVAVCAYAALSLLTARDGVTFMGLF